MTPALLARFDAALAALSVRYGTPTTASITTSLNGTDALVVQPCAQYVRDSAQVSFLLSQSGPEPVSWQVVIRATKDAAMAWCSSIEAGTRAFLGMGSTALMFDTGNLTVGTGPIYAGIPSAAFQFLNTVSGPYALTPTQVTALTGAIRAILAEAT